MSEKVIARLLCGDCPPNRRSVLARLVDGPDGAELRGRLVAPQGHRRSYDGVRLIDMSPDSFWWGDAQPHAIELRCADHHHSVAITATSLQEIEAEYRRTGRAVALTIHHR